LDAGAITSNRLSVKGYIMRAVYKSESQQFCTGCKDSDDVQHHAQVYLSIFTSGTSKVSQHCFTSSKIAESKFEQTVDFDRENYFQANSLSEAKTAYRFAAAQAQDEVLHEPEEEKCYYCEIYRKGQVGSEGDA
jgi:hypothetical protein